MNADPISPEDAQLLRSWNRDLRRLTELEAENARLRAGLRRIADANSGHWGWIAHETLHPERAAKSEKEN